MSERPLRRWLRLTRLCESIKKDESSLIPFWVLIRIMGDIWYLFQCTLIPASVTLDKFLLKILEGSFRNSKRSVHRYSKSTLYIPEGRNHILKSRSRTFHPYTTFFLKNSYLKSNFIKKRNRVRLIIAGEMSEALEI